MKKIIVTGASGFVGSHIVEQGLGLEDVDMIGLVRESSDTSYLESLDASIVKCNFDDKAMIREALTGADCVVHCAAKVGDWGNFEDYKRVNVDLTKDLIEACVESETVKQFIYISSLGVYSSRDHYNTDESTPVDDSGIDPYTRTKAHAESLVSQYASKHDIGITVLRPGFIYGSRDNTVLPSLINNLQKGRVVLFGDGDQKMNNTYVGNLVDAVFLSINKPECQGTFNIHDGKLASKKEFINLVAKYCGSPLVEKKIPLFLAKALAYSFDFIYRLFKLKSSPLISRAKYKFMGLNLSFSIDKAVRELGYAPDPDFTKNLKKSIAGK